METYLPIIDQYYSDWLAWALINQINAGILVGAVFLITAILYSLRIGFLKRKIRKNEKLHTAKQAELSAQIDITQQELKSAQDQLLISTEQLQLVQQTAESESERAKNHENLVNQRNEQISNLIQSLAIKFDLGERPVPLMGDIKADGLWQQHDRVTILLAHRLQTEQQAKAQFRGAGLACQAQRLQFSNKCVLCWWWLGCVPIGERDLGNGSLGRLRVAPGHRHRRANGGSQTVPC